jgi:hypothetical protein
MSEVQGNAEQGKPEKHLVILVHGINTFADWMPAMAETLESAGFLVAPTSFGEMPVSRFLLPFQSLRQQAVQRVLTNIRTARELYTPDKISVITHSFGTYVVSCRRRRGIGTELYFAAALSRKISHWMR